MIYDQEMARHLRRTVLDKMQLMFEIAREAASEDKCMKELTFEEYEAMRCIEKLIFMKRQEIVKLEDRLKPYYDILEKTDD